MKPSHWCSLPLVFVLAASGFAHQDKKPVPDCLVRLKQLGLQKFAYGLAAEAPDLIREINKSNDITIWAPGNDAVARYPTPHPQKRSATSSNYKTNVSTDSKSGTGSRKRKLKIKKRTIEVEPEYSMDFPDSNFQKIYTFLDDPDYVNLGDLKTLQLAKNFASPSDDKLDSLAIIEVASGLGDVQHTVRGPFKCRNGVIYEVNDFFTLPQKFSTTMKHLNISEQFFNTVVESGKLPLFEKTPAVTIFAPIDKYATLDHIDPESYILTKKYGTALFFTADFYPGDTLIAKSGAKISIGRSEYGEPLVNCQRIVKPNVVTKNGVIHFIEGPLYGKGNKCTSKY